MCISLSRNDWNRMRRVPTCVLCSKKLRISFMWRPIWQLFLNASDLPDVEQWHLARIQYCQHEHCPPLQLYKWGNWSFINPIVWTKWWLKQFVVFPHESNAISYPKALCKEIITVNYNYRITGCNEIERVWSIFQQWWFHCLNLKLFYVANINPASVQCNTTFPAVLFWIKVSSRSTVVFSWRSFTLQSHWLSLKWPESSISV